MQRTFLRMATVKSSARTLSISASVFAIMASPIHAQDIADDEIIVTARKIVEPLREVPFSIDVFDSGEINRRDLDEQRAFGRSVTGFNFSDTGLRGSTIPNIRGVGSFFPQSADDGSVPFFIDGVPTPLRAQDRRFFDISRIEVLKGPQNTLYGRNAQAGVVAIETTDPTFEPIAEIGGEVGNFDHYRLFGVLNSAVSETVAVRLSAQIDTVDGDIPDINLGTDVRGADILTVNGKLLWAPDDATDVKLTARFGNYNEEPTQGVFVENSDFPQAFLDRRYDYDIDTFSLSLQAERDFGNFSITSISGYQEYQSRFISDDMDGLVFQALTGFPPFFFNDPDSDVRNIGDDFEQLSQEFRLNTELENGIVIVTGASYYGSELDFDALFRSTGFIDGLFNNNLETDSCGIFAEVTWPLAEGLRLVTGGRYTREDRGFTGQYEDQGGFGLVPSAFEEGDLSFDLFTGRAALSYDVKDDLTTYFSIARGAKAGGFQLLDTDVIFGFPTSTFDEAITTSYEAGLRGNLLSNLSVSSAIFFNDTTDENLQVFDLTTFQANIENADTETYGFELSADFRPVDDLTLSGGFTYTESEITASPDPSVPADAEVPFTPEVAFNVAALYEWPLTVGDKAGDAFIRADYQYVGDRVSSPQNNVELPVVEFVNGRIGWNMDGLSVYAFVDNLLDENSVETSFLFGPDTNGDPVTLGIPTQPRRYGIGARIKLN